MRHLLLVIFLLCLVLVAGFGCEELGISSSSSPDAPKYSEGEAIALVQSYVKDEMFKTSEIIVKLSNAIKPEDLITMHERRLRLAGIVTSGTWSASRQIDKAWLVKCSYYSRTSEELSGSFENSWNVYPSGLVQEIGVGAVNTSEQ